MAARTQVQATKLSDELLRLEQQVTSVLPAHVGMNKFLRVVATAWRAPEIRRANRLSLFSAAIKCAQDGLLPDGREAIFTVYKTKDRATGKAVEVVEYQPMWRGILKSVRNSGQLFSVSGNAVFERDEFQCWTDDAGDHILHKPNLSAPNRGAVCAAYSIVKTTDGGVYTEVMTREQIEQVRACSKSKDGPAWSRWYDEMARKSVFRRLSKRLPISSELERVLARGDAAMSSSDATRVERSGAEAARHLLASALDDNAPTTTTEETLPAPRFDEASALEHLSAARDAQQLRDAWIDITTDYYDNRNIEVPLAVEAHFKDRLEGFTQQPESSD